MSQDSCDRMTDFVDAYVMPYGFCSHFVRDIFISVCLFSYFAEGSLEITYTYWIACIGCKEEVVDFAVLDS